MTAPATFYETIKDKSRKMEKMKKVIVYISLFSLMFVSVNLCFAQYYPCPIVAEGEPEFKITDVYGGLVHISWKVSVKNLYMYGSGCDHHLFFVYFSFIDEDRFELYSCKSEVYSTRFRGIRQLTGSCRVPERIYKKTSYFRTVIK